ARHRALPSFPTRRSSDLDEAVASAVRAGRLSASADTRSAVGEADVVVVIVPLIVAAADAIDYSNVDAATRAVGRSLRRGALVVRSEEHTSELQSRFDLVC